MKQITEGEFSAAEGVDGWRALYWGVKTLFDTGDFATGARFVAAIAAEAEAMNHAPIIELRIDSVTVQLITIDVGGISDLDVELARRINAVASGMGLVPTPAVQQLEIAFDAAEPDAVADFWRAALGYVQVAPGLLIEPNLAGPAFSFHDKAYVTPRNRIHVDISVPHDQAEARVAAVLDAGGRLLSDKHAPGYWSLIDAEGNVADIATWQDGPG